MGRAEQYRNLAASVRLRASTEPSPLLRLEWKNLAETYIRLAEQSETGTQPADDPIWDILGHSRH